MVLAFEGWNDAGEAATTVLRFVSDAIRSVPLAEIDSEEFYDFTVRRPNVVLDHTRTRRVVWPENHFRSCERFGPVRGSRGRSPSQKSQSISTISMLAIAIRPPPCGIGSRTMSTVVLEVAPDFQTMLISAYPP